MYEIKSSEHFDRIMTVILRFPAEFGTFGAHYVKVVEDRPIQSATEM